MSSDRSEPPSSNGLSWLDRISHAITGEPRDRRELVAYLRELKEQGLFNSDTLSMFEGVLEMGEMQVREIMLPRSQMVICQRRQTPEELLPILLESGHSRFPVIGDNRNEVVGILLAKDVLRYFATPDHGEFDIKETIRPPYFVPESKRLDVLLKDFRSNRNHMAIVVDEYGGVAGLVTIEDVLEQIVGEIDDEHDFDDDDFFMQKDADHCTVKALTPIEDFNDYFGTDFPDDDFDTIGGLVVMKFGRMPERGESVTYDGLTFKVVRADARRVYLLMVTGKRIPEKE